MCSSDLRPKRQLGFLVAALGSFVVGSIATNYGLKQAVLTLAKNQHSMASSIRSQETKILHLEGIMVEWAKDVKTLAELYVKLAKEDVTRDIDRQINYMLIQHLNDRLFIDAMLDTLLDSVDCLPLPASDTQQQTPPLWTENPLESDRISRQPQGIRTLEG